MKFLRTMKEHWDDDEYWRNVGGYAAAYGIWGMIALVAGLILAAAIL